MEDLPMEKNVFILIVLFLFTAPVKTWCNSPIDVQQGKNYIALELHIESSQSINELSIFLDDTKTASGIEMKKQELSFPDVSSGNQVTLPIQVNGIKGKKATAAFIVADDHKRIWSFQISLRMEQRKDKPNRLEPNYPNPFSGETTIHYTTNRAGSVTLKVYNTSGQVVQTLVDRQQAAGRHSVKWRGRDHTGQPVASGMYFYRLRTERFSKERKMLIID